MPNPSRQALEQEVYELTELLRTSSEFDTLRNRLEEHRLRPSRIVLAGLIEGEDNSRYGVILDGENCWLFETDSDESLILWERVVDATRLNSDFQAIQVAASMIRDGRLP